MMNIYQEGLNNHSPVNIDEMNISQSMDIGLVSTEHAEHAQLNMTQTTQNEALQGYSDYKVLQGPPLVNFDQTPLRNMDLESVMSFPQAVSEICARNEKERLDDMGPCVEKVNQPTFGMTFNQEFADSDLIQGQTENSDSLTDGTPSVNRTSQIVAKNDILQQSSPEGHHYLSSDNNDSNSTSSSDNFNSSIAETCENIQKHIPDETASAECCSDSDTSQHDDGSLELEIPLSTLKLYQKLRKGQVLEMEGNSKRNGSTQQQKIQMTMEKRASCVCLALKASAMGDVFKQKLTDNWQCVITSGQVNDGASRPIETPVRRSTRKTAVASILKANVPSTKEPPSEQVPGSKSLENEFDAIRDGNNTQQQSDASVADEGDNDMTMDWDVFDEFRTQGVDVPPEGITSEDEKCDQSTSVKHVTETKERKADAKDVHELIKSASRKVSRKSRKAFKPKKRAPVNDEDGSNDSLHLNNLDKDLFDKESGEDLVDDGQSEVGKEGALPLECRYCDRTFKWRSSRRHHESKCDARQLQEEPNTSLVCRYCKCAFQNIADREEHEHGCASNPYPKRVFRCSVCNKLYNTEAGRDKHAKGHIENLDDKTCKICGSSFQTKARMLRHQLKKHGGAYRANVDVSKFFPCKYCTIVFNNGSSRHRHQKFYCNSNPNVTKPFCCTHCGNFFTSKEELQTHQKHKHEKGTNYVCHVCGALLTSRSSIYFHKLKFHSGQAPKYQCSSCEKAYYTKHKLEKHMTRHTEDRHIQCELCGKQFKTPQHVAQHKKTIHEGRYRFHCPTCGHGMEKMEYLEKHKCGRVRRRQGNEEEATPRKTKPVHNIAKKEPKWESAATQVSEIEVKPLGPPPVSTYSHVIMDNSMVNQFFSPDNIPLPNSFQAPMQGIQGMEPTLVPISPSLQMSEHPYHVMQPPPNFMPPYVMPSNLHY